MNRHTVALMGLGIRGKIHLHGILENPDRYEVVGLCDIDPEKIAAANPKRFDEQGILCGSEPIVII